MKKPINLQKVHQGEHLLNLSLSVGLEKTNKGSVCRNKLNEVGKKNKVFLIWVLGYTEIKGNEEANTLAKEGARMSLIGPEPFCGIGRCTYTKEFLEKEKAEREKI